MTLARRLANVEATLSPTELILHWLDEAHAFGSIDAYVRWQLTEASLDPPLDRLAREAVTGARASLRGKGADAVDAAVRQALRETVFRFELVMRIIVTTHELLEREFLLGAILAGQLAMLASSDELQVDRERTPRERLQQCRDLTLAQVDELEAARQARETVEVRYLAGHPALFPDALAEWEEQLASARRLTAVAVRLAELDGIPLPEPPDSEAVAARAAQLGADLVEPAKATALEKLGEGERAFGIATGWVRGKLPRGVPPEATTR